MSLDDDLERARRERIERGRERELGECAAGADPSVDFTTNDYLGLARSPTLVEAARAALAEHGAGGRASRLLAGGSPVEVALEERAARWLACEAALFFPSGYQANLGVLTTLAGPGDAILSDAANHASIVDGARLSRALVRVFEHADPAALQRLLEQPAVRAARRRIVVCESIYSMDGDRAPLERLHALCRAHDAWLVVDEAHAVGLLGPRRAGLVAGLPDARRVAARIVTGGKALGAGGAIVGGSRALVGELVNRARSFVFTTASSPAVPAAFRAAIDAVDPPAGEAGASARAERALRNARRLAAALELPEPAAAIVPFVVGDERGALAVAEATRAAGFFVRAVRPPTVPAGTSRLRLTVHADHSTETLDALVATLRSRASAPNEDRRADAPRARPLFVTGTDTGIGKTVVSALLLAAAARRGPAGYWKPVQTGSDSDTAEVARLAGRAPGELPEPAYAFPLPASPHEAARAAGSSVDVEHLRAVYRERLGDRTGTLVCELAGGLLVPLTDDVTQLDWLARDRPELVLVARSGLGTLNHTLLSLEALAARHLRPRALFLVGDPHPSNRATLARASGLPIFEVPRFDDLEAGLAGWLDEHDLTDLFPATTPNAEERTPIGNETPS